MYTQTQDQELVRAMAVGDDAAAARLYRRYEPALLRDGARMLNQQDCADLLQDVFLEAWLRAESYDPQRGSVRRWLRLQLRCRAIDRRRSQGVAASAVPAPVDWAVESPHDAPDRARVRGALAALSPLQREALVLTYFQGMSASEIAEQLGVPVGTIKGRIRTGLQRLREVLEPKL